MKLSVSNIVWGEENLVDFFRLLKKENCDGVEIAPSLIWKEPIFSNKDDKTQNIVADSCFCFEKTWTDGRIAPVLRIQNWWAKSIINKTPIIPGLCEGLASHRVCEAIRKSSETGINTKI